MEMGRQLYDKEVDQNLRHGPFGKQANKEID